MTCTLSVLPKLIFGASNSPSFFRFNSKISLCHLLSLSSFSFRFTHKTPNLLHEPQAKKVAHRFSLQRLGVNGVSFLLTLRGATLTWLFDFNTQWIYELYSSQRGMIEKRSIECVPVLQCSTQSGGMGTEVACILQHLLSSLSM